MSVFLDFMEGVCRVRFRCCVFLGRRRENCTALSDVEVEEVDATWNIDSFPASTSVNSKTGWKLTNEETARRQQRTMQ